jgi:general L-amino acid transport system permease protein
MPPPPGTVGVTGWLRRNLFSSWANSLVTLVLGTVLVVLALLFLEWALTRARWGVVTTNFRIFLMWVYPFDEAWRAWLALAALSLIAGISAARTRGGPMRTLASWLAAGQVMLAVLAVVSALETLGSGEGGGSELMLIAIGLLLNAAIVFAGIASGSRLHVRGWMLGVAWLLWLPLTVLLLQGGLGPLLELVPTNLWGGLLLTFLLAIASIVLSFPFGVLLALGRRSDLPVVRWISTTYIELIRGVPLVTILFMAAVLLPFFLPGAVRPDHLYRAIAGLTLFSAAYVAENIRGGLQAIPSGQIEAAHAIGLRSYQTNLYVVLPQALRAVIPANVGLFISLLKDTTLVAIAGTGLLELLGIGQAVLAQPEWLGEYIEVYLFVSAVFFVMCYTMSQASYRLEAAMGVGTR